MANSIETVLIIHLSEVQRVIWQQVLQSQEIAANAQSPTADPIQTLNQIEQAGMPLPELLLIDTQVPGLNPKTFCQRCRDRYPDLKIILLGGKQVSPPERQAAIADGAFDLLPAFQVENLAVGAIAGVKRVLAAMGGKQLQKDLLSSSLVALKRELDSRPRETFSFTQEHHAPDDSRLEDSGSTTPSPPSPPETASPPKKPPKRSYRGTTY